MKNWIAFWKKLTFTVANKAGQIHHFLRITLFLLLCIATAPVMAATTQQRDTVPPAIKFTSDTTIQVSKAASDSAAHAKHMDSIIQSDKLGEPANYHSPRKAALYSAVLPGLGQAYNREYWKIPLVYAAIGTCTGFFIFNMKEYKRYRDAYRIRLLNNPDIHDEFETIYPRTYPADAIKVIRDQYRSYVDYSVLFFVLSYGLNIVDATVFAHLRSFDISDDLSLRVSPTIINNRTLGIGVNISLGGKKTRQGLYYAGR
ncbi:DUF5683 domain-containing protein [Chitinophaga sp. Cy-1792]|uniref:DUF5683 domain-containing protein n=1 Tax=Chitinophaga sp. Cy-1792 TaxID=2608339 RepID=UPI00142141BC|nr:DUF5683 domain-containing protein [Chitinophaga sp. Cy-1792]NIG53649.1 hypothetical protein [Chitinophaga sp. Cy-1792]